MRDIKLIALDLDGTLLTNEKKVTQETVNVLQEAKARGVYVVASTGRPYGGLPFAVLEEAGIEYAITANGSAIYKLKGKECLYSDGISPELAEEIVTELLDLGVHTDIFVDGQGYGNKKTYDNIRLLSMSDVMKDYMRTTRIYIDDLLACIRERNLPLQKITTNYYAMPDGIDPKRAQVLARYAGSEEVEIVSGGVNNLELTKKGISKGAALRILAELLGVDMSQTMACGDSENDMDIIRTAAVGVAMANAEECVKAVADYATLSNEEDGVADAVRKLVFHEEKR